MSDKCKMPSYTSNNLSRFVVSIPDQAESFVDDVDIDELPR